MASNELTLFVTNDRCTDCPEIPGYIGRAVNYTNKKIYVLDTDNEEEDSLRVFTERYTIQYTPALVGYSHGDMIYHYNGTIDEETRLNLLVN